MFPHFSVLSFSSLTLPPSPPKFRVSSHFSSPPLVCFLTLPHFFSPSTSTLPPVTLLHSYSLLSFFHTLYLSTPSLSINFFSGSVILVWSHSRPSTLLFSIPFPSHTSAWITFFLHTSASPHFCSQYTSLFTLLFPSYFFLHTSTLHFCTQYTYIHFSIKLFITSVFRPLYTKYPFLFTLTLLYTSLNTPFIHTSIASTSFPSHFRFSQYTSCLHFSHHTFSSH